MQISSNSSGKQKRPHSGNSFTNKESISNKVLSSRSPLSAIHSCMTSRKIRSPSLPIRRSISTDRASIIKTKPRIHTTSRRPIQKLQLPEPISNKSSASAFTEPHSQEQGPSRRVFNEGEDQSIQALSIKKNQLNQQSIELPETEMNCGLTDSFTGSAKVRKFQSIVDRISETMESRVNILRAGEQFLRGKHENKPPNSLVQNGKEGISCNAASELRRSRSLSRGKFMFS